MLTDPKGKNSFDRELSALLQ